MAFGMWVCNRFSERGYREESAQLGKVWWCVWRTWALLGGGAGRAGKRLGGLGCL